MYIEAGPLSGEEPLPWWLYGMWRAALWAVLGLMQPMGHGLNMRGYDVRRKFITQRAVRHWHRLPREAVVPHPWRHSGPGWALGSLSFILVFILLTLLFILLLWEARRTEKPIYFLHFSRYDLPPRDSSLLYFLNSQALLLSDSPFPLHPNYCVW